MARAAPDGYTIDIGQWDTHAGAIIFPINSEGTLVEQTAAAKIAGIQMMQTTGTKIEFIPYKGAGPAMRGAAAGALGQSRFSPISRRSARA